MGIFDKLLGKTAAGSKESASQNVIETMMLNAEICMNEGKYEQAFVAYKQIVTLRPDPNAQYNLGSLYAQGKGTAQNYLEGAYWFHQASLQGDEQAGRFRTKCLMDYVHQNLEQKTPQTVYDEMLRFASYLYPRENGREIANKNLTDLAGYHMNKKEYGISAKLFRAAAEYGDCGAAQNYLAVLYNAGAGVKKNDLAALYWFDRAVDNKEEKAVQDRKGILDAYRKNLSPEEFYNQMETLAEWCAMGSADVPKDAKKAEYWRRRMSELC